MQLRRKWKEADTDHSNTLEFSEILRLLNMCNINIKEKEARRRFTTFDTDSSGALDFMEFRRFFAACASFPREAESLFKSFSSDGVCITAADLRRFMLDIQQVRRLCSAVPRVCV